MRLPKHPARRKSSERRNHSTILTEPCSSEQYMVPRGHVRNLLFAPRQGGGRANSQLSAKRRSRSACYEDMLAEESHRLRRGVAEPQPTALEESATRQYPTSPRGPAGMGNGDAKGEKWDWQDYSTFEEPLGLDPARRRLGTRRLGSLGLRRSGVVLTGQRAGSDPSRSRKPPCPRELPGRETRAEPSAGLPFAPWGSRRSGKRPG